MVGNRSTISGVTGPPSTPLSVPFSALYGAIVRDSLDLFSLSTLIIYSRDRMYLYARKAAFGIRLNRRDWPE
jgi:hypothetical protein